MVSSAATPNPAATWESPLLALAYQGRRPDIAPAPQPVGDAALLARAYRHCEAVTSLHSKSFTMATRFLPREKRRAVRALYAFCRVTDDIVDCACDDRAARLAAWRSTALSPHPPPGDLVATAWADTRARYAIPTRYAEQLIEGVERDLHQKRYATFTDLAAYSYSVASTVGLMSMHIIGFAGPAAIAYAIKLGVALQLTNILRDVGEDWRAGRVYLPADELAAYGLTNDDLARGKVDDRWRSFVRFQITRTRRLYAEAWPGIALLHPDGRFAVAAAGDLYRAILDEIESHDYDVFHYRAHVGTRRKLRRLACLWWSTRRSGRRP
jgi:phytoene synthase